MAKRHLKVTGDLGRVIFMVCGLGGTLEDRWANSSIGIRSTKYRISRGKRKTLRCCL
jgi:hypothetical protein